MKRALNLPPGTLAYADAEMMPELMESENGPRILMSEVWHALQLRMAERPEYKPTMYRVILIATDEANGP